MQFIWKGVFLNPFNKDLSLSKMSFCSALNATNSCRSYKGTYVTGQN